MYEAHKSTEEEQRNSLKVDQKTFPEEMMPDELQITGGHCP